MEQALNPASLPEGTHVGPWRLGSLLGRGAYGTVYRAEAVGRGARGRAALKLAQAPNDARFEREVTLLSRLRHPCIPRLLGHGHWRSPSGQLHPFVAMERVFDHAWCISSQVSFSWGRVAGRRRSCCSRSLRSRVSS